MLFRSEIRDKEVRLIGFDGAQLGIVSGAEANAMAEEQGLDLVKISPNAVPPVCKIMDYSKFCFDQKKREKEAKKNQRVVGKGTEAMSKMESGKLDILTGLGNGYDLTAAGEKPVLLGGGVGVPPMYLLAKKLIAEGKTPAVILGFNKQEEIFYEEEFKALGCQVYVTTVDGSYGIRGFVTDALKQLDYTHFFTCGPEPMLKALYKSSTTSGQMSFEERMGCGFGACMGCSCKTLTGYKRICKDGPVMRKEEILWED